MTSPAKRPTQQSIELTIEQLRYWIPSIKDVARVYEGMEGQSWLLSIDPYVRAGCAVAVEIKDSGVFDIAIGGETYEDLALLSSDDIVLLLDRISAGHVIQRRWFSPATGALQCVETLVELGQGATWRGGPPPLDGGEQRDRHFLAYRRR
jgi:hypothetical protein